MFLKVFIFAAIALSYFSTEKTFASCNSYPYQEGLIVKEVEDGLKITSTTQVKVFSDNFEHIMNALLKGERQSKAQIIRYFSQGPGKNNSFQGILKGVVKVGECFESKKYVRVTLGISPKTIKAQSELMPQR